MSRAVEGQVRLQKGGYVGDVTALTLLPNPDPSAPAALLLAGCGGALHVYRVRCGRMLLLHRVLDGARIHGIQTRLCASNAGSATYLVAVHGDRMATVCTLRVSCPDGSDEVAQLQLQAQLGPYVQWVLDVRLLHDTSDPAAAAADDAYPELHAYPLLAVGQTNNSVEVWDWQRRQFRYRVRSVQACLLYSMALTGDTPVTLRAAAGTIWASVLLYAASPPLPPTSCSTSTASDSPEHKRRNTTGAASIAPARTAPTLLALRGHEGSVHRVVWSACGRWVGSCSDDRTIRVWDVSEMSERSAPATPAPAAVMYGHGGRLWDCALVPEADLVVTASEDCTCRVWSLAGAPLTTLQGHRGRGVWRCTYDTAAAMLVSGGADASIKLFDIAADVAAARARLAVGWTSRVGTATQLLCAPGCDKPSKGNKAGADHVKVLQLVAPNVMYVATNRGRLLRCEWSTDAEAAGEDERWRTLWADPNAVSVQAMDVQRPWVVPGQAYDLNGTHAGSECSHAALDAHGRTRWTLLGDVRGRATAVAAHDTLCAQCGATLEGGSECTASPDTSTTWMAHEGQRVLGVRWIQQRMSPSSGCRAALLTTDSAGEVRMWALAADGGSVRPLATFRSPLRARVCSMAVDAYSRALLAGDMNGALLVFDVTVGEAAEQAITSGQAHEQNEVDLRTPVQVLQHAHKGGTHFVRFDYSGPADGRASASVLRCVSGGKDGHLNTYELTLRSESGGGGADSGMMLTRVNREHVASMTVLASLHVTANGERIVAGFQANDFVVWSLTHQSEVTRVSCGGWNRAASWLVGARGAASLRLAYVKQSELQVTGRWPPPPAATAATAAASAACGVVDAAGHRPHPPSLHMCFHGRETNAARWTLPPPLLSAGATAIADLALISGAEDGSLISLQYRCDPAAALSQPVRAVTVGQHAMGSSVRDVALAQRPPGTAVDASHVLVTVGSKQVTMLWLLEWELHASAEASDDEWRLATKQLSTVARPANEGHIEGDVRHTAVAAFCLGDRSARTLVVFVVAAASDATLALHAYVAATDTWCTLAWLSHHRAPVLALQFAPLASASDADDAVVPEVVLFSGTTDATMGVWHLTAVVDAFWRSLQATRRGYCGGDVVQGIQGMHQLVRPALVMRGVHQSGVNCLSVAHMPTPARCGEGTEAVERRYMVVSGGDDQAMHAAVVACGEGVGPHGVATARLVTSGHNELAHSSSLKGVWTDGRTVFSTGLDQRLHVWRLQLPTAGEEADERAHVGLQLLTSTVTEVAEPSSLDAMHTTASSHADGETLSYSVLIAGRGVQVVECHVPRACL